MGSHQKQLTICKDMMVIKALFFLFFLELCNTRPSFTNSSDGQPIRYRTGTVGTSFFNEEQRVGSGNVEGNANCRRSCWSRFGSRFPGSTSWCLLGCKQA